MEHKSPADYVVAVLNDEVIADDRVTRPRPDLPYALGCPRCSRAGFDLIIPLSRLRGAPVTAVRVFAIAGSRGAEILTMR